MTSWAAKLKANAPPTEPEAPKTDPVVAAEQAPAEQVVDGRKVVLDSGAIIKGGRVERLGDKFWTVGHLGLLTHS
jgi:hypothetical protein